MFLKSAGVFFVAVSGGAVWRAYDTGVLDPRRGAAFEPWDTWQADSDRGPLPLVRAAILAANPFNTQPWLFRVSESDIDVFADNTRNTGKFDPYLREQRIGLGCAVENLMLAAPVHGYRATLTVTPGALGDVTRRPGRELVAQVHLESPTTPTASSPTTIPRAQNTLLYRAIPHRHTNRYAFDPTVAIAEDFAAALQDLSDDSSVLIRCFTDDAHRAQFVDICTQSVLQDATDADARTGAAPWARDERSVLRLHDGNTIDDAGQPPLTVAAAKFFPPRLLATLQPSRPPDLATAIKQGYTSRLDTARLFGLIAVRDLYDQRQAIAAGRLWQRSHLLATVNGIAARPVNQPVQLVDHQRMHGQPMTESQVLTRITADSTWLPTFMFMMGHPTRAAHQTARRGVTEVVI